MKLIFCPKCYDVVNLIVNQKRACMCGLSWGQYTDETNALVGGHAIPFGINNHSFRSCLDKYLFTFEGFFYNNEITTSHIQYEKKEIITDG